MSGAGLPEYVKSPVYEEPLGAASGGFILAAPPQSGVAAKFDVSSDVVVLEGKTGRGMVRMANGTQWNLQDVLGKPICLEGTCSCPSGSAGAVLVSARTGAGVPELLQVVASRLALDTRRVTISFDSTKEFDREQIARLYRVARVVSHVATNGRVLIEADVPRRFIERLTSPAQDEAAHQESV